MASLIDREWEEMNNTGAFKSKNQSTTAGLISLESRTKKKKKKKTKKTQPKPKPGDGASLAEMVQWINDQKKYNKNKQQPQVLTANRKFRNSNNKNTSKGTLPKTRSDNPEDLGNTANSKTNSTTTTAATSTTHHNVVDRSNWTLDDLLGRLQRDLNLLSDESQQKRVRALERLEITLFSAPDVAPDPKKAVPFEALRQFYPHAMKPLLRRFADPTEPCREIAIRLMIKFVEHTTITPDLAPTLPYAWPAILERTSREWAYDEETKTFTENPELFEEKRRGKAHKTTQQLGCVVTRRVVEPSEEVRMQLGTLVFTIVDRVLNSGAPTQLAPYFSDTIFLALTNSVDPFPKAKLAGMQLLRLLCDKVPPGTKHFAVGLVKEVMPALGHRLSKIRVAGLETINALVQCPDVAKCRGAGTEAIVDLIGHRDANVIPIGAFYHGEARLNHFAKLITDTNIAVKMTFVDMLGEWMRDLPDRFDHHSRLLPYMLSMLSDSHPPICEKACWWMEQLGRMYEEERTQVDKVLEKRQYGVDGDRHSQYDGFQRPFPFKGRPRLGARMFVKASARRFLKPLLAELTDWRDATRVHAANLLRSCIVYLEEHITIHLHKLVGTLCRCAKGMSEEWSKECTGLVARFVPTDSLIDLVLPIVREDPDGAKGVRVSGAGSRGRALIVLSQIIKVTKRSRIEAHARDIGMALGDVDKAGTRDSVERRSLLICMLEYGTMFEGRSSFMNHSTGRLVTLNNVVEQMMACVEISSKLLEQDVQVGTVGAEEAAGMCGSVMKRLKAIVVNPNLVLADQSNGGGGGGGSGSGSAKATQEIVSSNVGGSVKVEHKTVDLDSDGEGMEDFDVE